jgi:hypothetical protein
MTVPATTAARPNPRHVGIVLAALLTLSFALLWGLADAPAGHATVHESATRGTTEGWFNGRTVTLQYQKNFYCDTSISSGAGSGCELGADAAVPPRAGSIPDLYVAVPLFDSPVATQCPAGSCIDHPSTIDLSRVFGAGTENVALPAHSHVVDERAGGWWDVEVVGITSPAAWRTLQQGRSIATIHQLHDDGTATGFIPTNLDLFFNVVG